MATLESPKTPQEAGSGMDAIEIRPNPLPRYYTLLFAGLVLWGLLFIGWFLFSGWSSQGEFAGKMQRQQAQNQATAAAARPAQAPAELHALAGKLYVDNCAACHGADGAGGIGPALKAAAYRHGKERADVQASIAGGRPGGMPAFGNQLSPQEIEALVTYVTSL